MRILAIIILSLSLLASCRKETENNTDIVNDTIATDVKADTNNGSDEFTKRMVGDTIYGDFNGDGNFENAYRVLIKKGSGNPVEDGVPDEYEIHFSDKRIKPIKVDCCWFKLVNEGDLNKDGTEEITIVQAPENGCIGSVKVFTIKGNQGYLLIDPFLLFWCADITDAELQKLIVRENTAIYYYEADPNDENLLNDKGDRIRFERLRKNRATIIGTLPNYNSDALTDLSSVIEEANNGSNSRRDNETDYINNDVHTDYPERDVEVQDNTIYNAAGLQIQPEYPGGINVFYEYVQRNFKRPKIDRATNLKVILSFIVEKDGSLTDIKVLKDPGYDAGIEVERMLKSVANKWKPGILNGKPIRAEYTLPVVINVQGN